VVAERVKDAAARSKAKSPALVLCIFIAKNDVDKAVRPVLIDMS
jgi:hypothetical protein